MIKLSQRGFGIISLIILLALIFAALNVYAYYNPKFNLAKYSPLNYIRTQRDNERIAELKKLEVALIKYYEDTNQLPASDGWCGRINSVLHPEFAAAVKPYLKDNTLPNDPSPANINHDYFYYRVNKRNYVLQTVLELPKEGNKGLNVKNCHDWPGNDIYNYRLDNLED